MACDVLLGSERCDVERVDHCAQLAEREEVSGPEAPDYSKAKRRHRRTVTLSILSLELL